MRNRARAVTQYKRAPSYSPDRNCPPDTSFLHHTRASFTTPSLMILSHLVMPSARLRHLYSAFCPPTHLSLFMLCYYSSLRLLSDFADTRIITTNPSFTIVKMRLLYTVAAPLLLGISSTLASDQQCPGSLALGEHDNCLTTSWLGDGAPSITVSTTASAYKTSTPLPFTEASTMPPSSTPTPTTTTATTAS